MLDVMKGIFDEGPTSTARPRLGPDPRAARRGSDRPTMHSRPRSHASDDERGARRAELRTCTLWQTLSSSAERLPDRVALVAANDAGEVQRLTYAGLVERARALSAGLASIGVRRGDRVVLWITNTPEWVISYFASTRLGASVVPVNTFLKPAEVAYVLVQSGARHVILLDAFRALRMPEMLAEICPEFADAGAPGFLASETEAVRQLRGTQGERQVPGAKTALLCAGSSFFHDPAAVVLRAE
jgi:non-ribosomal peptide synthetase component F